jgi:hypothetical protein
MGDRGEIGDHRDRVDPYADVRRVDGGRDVQRVGDLGQDQQQPIMEGLATIVTADRQRKPFSLGSIATAEVRPGHAAPCAVPRGAMTPPGREEKEHPCPTDGA